MWTDERGKQFADATDFAKWGHAFGIGAAKRILSHVPSLSFNPFDPEQVAIVQKFKDKAVVDAMKAACEFAASRVDASQYERDTYVRAAEAGLRDQMLNPDAEVILSLEVQS